MRTSSYPPELPAAPASFVELLRWRALHQANHRAVTFLLDGERKEASLTYRELDCQARAVAAWLQRNGLAGERAIILVSPGGAEHVFVPAEVGQA